MQILKMSNGREWVLKINIATVMQVRARVLRRNGQPLDLMQIVNVSNAADPGAAKMDLLEEIVGDSLLLVEIIYALLKPQLDVAKITEEEFYISLSGDDIENAVDVLMRELIDFFPEAKKRVLRKIWDTIGKIQTRAQQMMGDLLNAPDIDARIEKLTRGILSGDAPELSESTPEA